MFLAQGALALKGLNVLNILLSSLIRIVLFIIIELFK